MTTATPPAPRAPTAQRQTDQAILDQSQTAGYLTVGARSPHRIHLRNRWAAHCERAQIPFVVIETRKRYAQVECDLVFQKPRPGASRSIYSTWHLSDATVERIAAMLAEHNATRTDASAGSVFSYAYRIPLAQAAFVAGRLAALAAADIQEGLG